LIDIKEKLGGQDKIEKFFSSILHKSKSF